MKFDPIIPDGRLWAVRYDGMEDNILFQTFSNWVNYDWLKEFFVKNSRDLSSYFHITSLEEAIYDTFSDAVQLQSVILDLTPDNALNKFFRPLDNYRTAEMALGKEKAKGFRQSNHASWLRLYALKLDENTFLITGGAIKLTRTMQEREHTLSELFNLEKVRSFLINNGIFDADGFKDMQNQE